MKRNKVLRTSALAAALYMATIAGVQAQSTTGSIAGSVGDGAGKTVLVTNNSGFSREVPVDAGGHYSIGNLPLGTYKVVVKSAGSEVESRDDIEVIVGRSTDVSFGGGGTTTLTGVSIRGSRVSPIDVTSVDTRTVITSEQLQQLPLARNAEAIALLAPGVVNNSGGYKNGALGGSLPSFGGSAASENAYYLNGFNTTDPSRSLGGLTLPYGAIEQQEIYTGGYGAQYGRSNGGVINQVGKSGTNDWHFGAAVNWEPDGLKHSQKDLYFRPDSTYDDPSSTSYTKGLYEPDSETSSTSTTYSAYVGGPIIKDRLFFFAAVEKQKSTGSRVEDARTAAVANGVGVGGEPWVNYDYEQTRAYGKIDWHITDNHLLELTGAEDKAKTNGTYYAYDYLNREVGAKRGEEAKNKTGPSLWAAKYTGYFGDNVTVTALYGEESSPIKVTQIGYSADNGPYLNNTGDENPAYTHGTPIINDQISNSNPIQSPDQKYKKNNLRLNLNWKLGDHTLDFGVDNQKSKGIDIGSSYNGPGYQWTYGHTSDPTGLNSGGLVSGSATADGGVGVPSPGLADPTYGSTGYYVTKDISTSLYSYKASQKAYYVEDHWQVSENFLLSLGLRDDVFTNYIPAGDPYIKVKNTWAPRIGFSWDVNGDSSLKVYGNLGRYYLGLPLSPVGLFTPAVATSTYYTYSGINADGTPITATQLAAPASANSRFGQIADVQTAVAKNIKGSNQDELILGFTKQLDSGWVAGVRGTIRRLNRDIDDVNVDSGNAGLVAAAQAAGLVGQDYGGATWYWDPTKTSSAALINPGKTNTYRVVGWDGEVHDVSVTRDQQGFPKLSRNYASLEFTTERPFDGTWYAKLSYTWSHSYGTTEGELRSDLWRTNASTQLALPGGYTGQAATSTTQSWDAAALMENFNGDQSNDHRHAFKAFAYYQLTREWGVSGNLSLISGAPVQCLGYYYGSNYDPGDRDPAGYANATITGGPYHFCYNPDTGVGEASPPGSHGRLGWITELDTGVTYKPDWAKGLAFQLNVFNVTNAQTATVRYPFSELNPGQVNPLYNQSVDYQTPRYARLTLSYDY